MHFQNLTQKKEFPNILVNLLKIFSEVEIFIFNFYYVLDCQGQKDHYQLWLFFFVVVIVEYNRNQMQ